MGSYSEMDTTTNEKVIAKPALKATPEVRMAFDELVSEEGFVKSSETILKYFASLMSPGQENEELPNDAKYVIKRLITSLASQRMNIRQGCYTIFQVLLQLYPSILSFSWSSIEDFYKDKHQEALTDYTMGHVLALGAIIRSGLAAEETLPLEDVVGNLLKMKDSKYVVGPVVGQFLVNLFFMYKDKNVIRTIWKVCQESLQADMGTLPAPLIWLRVLIARDEYINELPDVPESFQKSTYDESTYEYIFSVLKKLFTVGVNITPMVEDYFKSLILYQPNNSDGENNLSLFFSTAVTPALSSKEKTNVLIFNISQVALSYLTSKNSIEAVISQELMEMLISSIKSKNDEVNASARGLFSAILQLLVKNKEKGVKIQIAVMKRLVSTSSKFRIDAVTETKVLQQATDSLSDESVIGFVKFLVKSLGNLIDESKSEKFKDIASTCHWINRLMGHSSMTGFDQLSWKAEQVSHLFRVAFLSGFNEKQQQNLKDSFLKSLGHASNNVECQASFIEEVVNKVHQLVINGEFKELNKDSINLFISTTDKLKKLSPAGNNPLSSGDLAVFKILFGYISLGAFMDPKDSEELIEEIKVCYKNASKGKKKKGKSLGGVDEKGEEPEWREVVLDLLLSLISKEENLWRQVATVVFTNICHNLKPSVLSILTDVINPEKEEIILEGKTNNEETMDQSSIDGEDMDTSMEVDTEEMSESEDALDETDEEDSDEEEMEDGDKDKIEMINLKMKMQEIVGSPMENVELDSVPQEEFDNLDKQLGSLINQYVALKSKRKKKKKLTKDETALMCFKTRVCDLLETLIKEAPSLDHILEVMKPILMAINKTLEDKLLGHFLGKLRPLIVEISKVKKFSKSSSISPEGLATFLKDIFSMGSKFSKEMKGDFGHCCTFLVRSEQYLNDYDENETSILMKTYTEYLRTAFSEMSSELYDGPIYLETGSLEMVLKVILEMVFKNSTLPLKKKIGIEMLKDILNNENALMKISNESLMFVLQTIKKEIVRTFDNVKLNKHIQSNYLIMLIDVLKSLKKMFNTNKELEESFAWDEITLSINNFCQRVSLKEFKILRRTLQSLANIIVFKLKSYEGEENDCGEVASKTQKSKKKRKLEEIITEGKEGKEETLKEKRIREREMKKLKKETKKLKKEMRKKEKMEEFDLEGETGEKKKKKKNKKKKNTQGKRRQKNEARLWIGDEVGSFTFAKVDSLDVPL